MTRIAPIPPAESDLLCEFCGYTLNGLPQDSRCPECGMPIAASAGSKRQPPLWERTRWSFVPMTWQIISCPTAFFSGVTARGDTARASGFGFAHWLIVSILFGIAGAFHATLVVPAVAAAGMVPAVSALTGIAYLTLWLTTKLAVRLTTWEAAYRGIRLPLPVVTRSMYYHAAHYLPVALLAVTTVVTFHQLYTRGIVSADYLTTYLYVLCGEIIVAAAYLFKTYWIGMRNMMYANR